MAEYVEVFFNGQPQRISSGQISVERLKKTLGADPLKELFWQKADDPLTDLTAGDEHVLELTEQMRFWQRPDEPEDEEPLAGRSLTGNFSADGRVDLPSEERAPRIYIPAPRPVEAYRTAIPIYNSFESTRMLWANAGDWIIKHPDGSKEVMSDAVFRASYRLVNVSGKL